MSIKNKLIRSAVTLKVLDAARKPENQAKAKSFVQKMIAKKKGKPQAS